MSLQVWLISTLWFTTIAGLTTGAYITFRSHKLYRWTQVRWIVHTIMALYVLDLAQAFVISA